MIVLRAGTYQLTVANISNGTGNNLQDNAAATGDLDVTEANRLVVIQGQGAGLTIIDATGLNDRVFHILANARLELRGVTVRGGVATEQGTPGVPNGAARGGGIFNAGGDLVLDRVKVNKNEARGRAGTAFSGEGGGVHSTGSLFITASTIANNRSVGAEGLQGSFSTVAGRLRLRPRRPGAGRWLARHQQQPGGRDELDDLGQQGHWWNRGTRCRGAVGSGGRRRRSGRHRWGRPGWWRRRAEWLGTDHDQLDGFLEPGCAADSAATEGPASARPPMATAATAATARAAALRSMHRI